MQHWLTATATAPGLLIGFEPRKVEGESRIDIRLVQSIYKERSSCCRRFVSTHIRLKRVEDIVEITISSDDS
jgi:hypothetical protein